MESSKNTLSNVFANLIKNNDNDLQTQLKNESFLLDLKEVKNFAELSEPSALGEVPFSSFGKSLNFQEISIGTTTDKASKGENDLSGVIEKLDLFNEFMENFSEIPEEFSNNKDFSGKNIVLNVEKYGDFSGSFFKPEIETREITVKNNQTESDIEAEKFVSMEKITNEEMAEDFSIKEEDLTEEIDEQYEAIKERDASESLRTNVYFSGDFHERENTDDKSRQDDQEIRKTISSILDSREKSQIESNEIEYQDLQKDRIEILDKENNKESLEEIKFEDYFQAENDKVISFSPKKAAEIYQESAEFRLDEKITDQLKTSLAKITPTENKFIVQLEPRGLGGIYIEVNFENDAVESIMIEAVTHQAFKLLHGEIPELKNALNNLGFQVPEEKLNLSLSDRENNNQNNSRRNKEEKLIENLKDVTEKVREFMQYYPGISIIA